MYQTFLDCTTPSYEGGSLSVPNLAILKVDTLVDHAHFAHTIHPITVEAFGKPNRDQCTASVCGNLDDLTRIRLAVVLLTLETETNLNRSKLSHLHLSSCDTLIIHYISANARKKIGRKKDFLACYLAQDLLVCHFGRKAAVSAILAVIPPLGEDSLYLSYLYNPYRL